MKPYYIKDAHTKNGDQSPVFRSISVRLLLYILFVSSFFTLVATAYQLFLDYRNDLSFIDKQLIQIEKQLLKCLFLA